MREELLLQENQPADQASTRQLEPHEVDARRERAIRTRADVQERHVITGLRESRSGRHSTKG
jgi:hypothetical protein